jgi:hypothetical protein
VIIFFITLFVFYCIKGAAAEPVVEVAVAPRFCVELNSLAYDLSNTSKFRVHSPVGKDESGKTPDNPL